MKHRSLLVWCLIVCMALGIISGGKIQAWAGESEMENDRFDISVTVGMDGYAKNMSYIPLHFEITNHGDDFAGKVSVQVTSDYSRAIAYTKDFFASAGEVKPVNMEIPSLSGGDLLNVYIEDDQEQVIYRKTIRAGLIYSKDIYVGILSDDFEGLNFFSGLPVHMSESDQYRFSRIFSLSERNFPESSNGLECLDMIVINHFDTSRLSKEQYRALKGWVADGGVLLIGTGVYGSETLSMFSDDYLPISVGGLLSVTLNFDLEGFEYATRTEPMDYAQPVIEEIEQTQETKGSGDFSDSSSTSSDSYYEYGGDIFSAVLTDIMPLSLDTLDLRINRATDVPQVLCQSLTRGKGRIVVAKFDLSDPVFDTWPHYTAALGHLLEVTGAGDTIMENTDISSPTASSWYVTSMLTNVLDGKLPQIGGYVIFFFIYIVLVAPAAYIVLKKIDRRELLWIVIPVLAVCFTGVMFMLGNSTRQQKPFFNYGTMLELNGNTASENIYFSITSPKNRGYSFDVDNEYRLSYIDANYDFIKTDSDRNDYDMNMTYGSDQTGVEIRNVKAFDSQYFLAQKTLEFSESVHTQLKYTSDGYTGQIENETNYQIRDAFLYIDDTLIDIGDIGIGETVSVENSSRTYENTSIYDIGQFLYPDHQDSGASDIDLTAIARKNMVQTYYMIYADHMYSTPLVKRPPQILGFFEGYPVNISEKTDYEIYGVTMFASDVTVDYTMPNGEVMIPDLSGCIKILNGSIDFSDNTFMDDILEVIYMLPESVVQPVKLQMSYGEADDLNIAFYNYSTNQYDPVFEKSDELSNETLKNYIANGMLRVRIEKVDKNLYNSTHLPVFSVTGRDQ